MYGRTYKQLIGAQRRRKIEFFGPWPSEFSLQARTELLEISKVPFGEWEEINEDDKKIREIHRLTTQEQLPIRCLSAVWIFLCSLATQLLQQCKRFEAEVQLVADKVFNYVYLRLLGPVLAVLCCLVKCRDDRSGLCWMLKLVSTCHPILRIGVHVCDKIVDPPTSPTSTQPLSSAPNDGLKTETQKEKLARLMAMCDKVCSQR